MKAPNLSEWSLKHPSMVLYLMVVLMTAGVMSYFKLGRAEDPDFTFKVMVVRTLWPGATAREVELELTERIGEGEGGRSRRLRRCVSIGLLVFISW